MLLKSMYSVACACLPSLLCMWCSAFWIRDACTLVVCCRTPCWHCCQARVLLCSVSVLALRYCFQFKKTAGGSALQTSYSTQSFYYNQQNVRTTMDRELNGQRTQWTKNSMDKELNGQRTQWTKNSMDKELNAFKRVTTTAWKTISDSVLLLWRKGSNDHCPCCHFLYMHCAVVLYMTFYLQQDLEDMRPCRCTLL